MTFRLVIHCNTPAFSDEGDNGSFEVAAILDELAHCEDLPGNPKFGPGYGKILVDSDGREVGLFAVTEDFGGTPAVNWPIIPA